MAKFSKDGAGIIKVKDSNDLLKSIVRIAPKKENRKKGTGFFVKIKNENNNTEFNFLTTNYHIIKKEMVENMEKIDIYFSGIRNPKLEKKREIILDKTKRYIKCDSKHDFSLIQILKKDRIDDERYLKPDLNCKKGCKFYEGKNCYLIGYPSDKNSEKKQEAGASTGKIIKYNGDYDFEHDIDTVNCSSGSAICLKDNLHLVGIHKGTSEKKERNYGTFFEIIIKDVQKKEVYKEINLKKEEDDLNSSDEEESDDLPEPFLKKPSKKESEFLMKIIFLVFFLNFINLKMILISEENLNNVIFNIRVFLGKLICFCVAFYTNKKFLFSLIVLQVLIVFYSFYAYLYFPKEEENLNLILFPIIASFLRVYNKDLFILKLYQNGCHYSMSFLTYTEGAANIFTFILIYIIHTILSIGGFKRLLSSINFLLNLVVSIILFYNNEKLDLIFNKINKWNKKSNVPHSDEFILKKIAKNIYDFIIALSAILLYISPSWIPSYYFCRNQNLKLFLFISFNFLGRNIIFLVGKLNSSKKIILLSSLLYLIFLVLYRNLESYIILTLFSFGYGTYVSFTYDIDKKELYNFYNFSLYLLLFIPF